jgi:hypothetical protein
MRQAGGVGLRAMRRQDLRGAQPDLNGASVIFSPFIGVELTCWKARTLPQVIAVFDPLLTSTRMPSCDAIMT